MLIVFHSHWPTALEDCVLLWLIWYVQMSYIYEHLFCCCLL